MFFFYLFFFIDKCKMLLIVMRSVTVGLEQKSTNPVNIQDQRRTILCFYIHVDFKMSVYSVRTTVRLSKQPAREQYLVLSQDSHFLFNTKYLVALSGTLV